MKRFSEHVVWRVVGCSMKNATNEEAVQGTSRDWDNPSLLRWISNWPVAFTQLVAWTSSRLDQSKWLVGMQIIVLQNVNASGRTLLNGIRHELNGHPNRRVASVAIHLSRTCGCRDGFKRSVLICLAGTEISAAQFSQLFGRDCVAN